MSVFIEGDRSVFLSKSAIDRFKKDVKETTPDAIDSSKYLKEGYAFLITKSENAVNATIITSQQVLLDEKRRQLKQRLNMAKKQRSGEAIKQLESLKRTIPDKVFKSYINLIRNYQVSNIPSPDEIINNPEKFRTQITTIMGTKGPVSNDQGWSNAIKNYFNTIGRFMGMEPIENDDSPYNYNDTIVTETPKNLNSDTEDEDEN
jgi:hypothetical protein